MSLVSVITNCLLICYLPFTLVVFVSHREACENALKEKHFLDNSQTEGFLDETIASHLKQLEALGQVFERAVEDDAPSEVASVLYVIFVTLSFSI